MTGVAELLSASLSAHEAAKPAPGRPRDLVKVAEAKRLRVQAAEMDPDFTDPAWSTGKVSHKDLMAFYRGLNLPEPVEPSPVEPVPDDDLDTRLKAALSECLDVIAGDLDPKAIEDAKADDEGLLGVYARGKALL